MRRQSLKRHTVGALAFLLLAGAPLFGADGAEETAKR